MMTTRCPRGNGKAAIAILVIRGWVVVLAILSTLPVTVRAQGEAIAPPTRPYIDLTIEPEPRTPVSEFAIGVALASTPEYSGSNRRSLDLKPIFAYRYGRFKLSSSGGSTILNFGSTIADDSGASARLIDSDHWKLKTSLRIGGGRNSSDSIDLDGLPDLRKTVFARVLGTYKFDEHLHVDTTVGFDLLGRGNGAFLTTSVGYGFRVTPATEISFGSGLTFGNATHMMGLYGVPLSARTDTRDAYTPGAGVKDISIGAGFTTELSSNWIAFGGVGYGRLLGPAADSPLTTGRSGATANIGIGWRCCR